MSGSLLADSTIYQPMQVLREEMYYVLKTYLWIILGFLNPSNSQDLIVNSLLELLCISLKIDCKNIVLDQDNNLYLISMSVLVNCWLLITCGS